MIQRYSISLKRNADLSVRTFEEIAEEAFEVLSILQKYPNCFRPNYRTVRRKRDAKPMEWNFFNFSEELKKGVNKEGGTIFSELGYMISFFSSLTESESCAIRMCVGNTNKDLFNTLDIDLPYFLNLQSEENSELIYGLFADLVENYKPIFGCTINNVMFLRETKPHYENKLPTKIQWLNYWPQNIVSSLGEKRISCFIKENSEVSYENGILRTKKKAFDCDNRDDMEYYSRLNEKLFGK